MKDEVLMISRSGTSKLLNKGFQEQFYEAIKSRKRDDSLQLDVRKLREAIVATGRNDKFAVDVYEYSVDLAISSGNFQELIKSLSYLHSFLYDNAVDYPRKAEIIAYYLYYLTCYTVSENKLTGSTIEVLKVYQKYPALTDERVIVQAIDWLRALNLDVDYVGLQNVWKNTSTSERIIIQV
ncbi:hypothetical protein HDV02_002395 [Globomyces sp. JEL0801]|nr:hypothetical protein HDV02_002395 [Globomyces sp. JEL0801]